MINELIALSKLDKLWCEHYELMNRVQSDVSNKVLTKDVELVLKAIKAGKGYQTIVSNSTKAMYRWASDHSIIVDNYTIQDDVVKTISMAQMAYYKDLTNIIKQYVTECTQLQA